MGTGGHRGAGDDHVPLVAEVRDDGDVRTVVLHGELDLAGAATASEAIGRAVRPGADLVLDLRALGFIDSTGARTLAEAAGSARRAGARRIHLLLDDGGPVAKILRMTGADVVFDHP